MHIKDRDAMIARRKQIGPIYLSAKGFAQFKKNLEHLKKELPLLAAEAARTAAYGDRSDNAEYKDAKGRLRRVQWKILEMNDELKRIIVIPQGHNKTGTVEIGSRVMVEAQGVKKQFEILGPRETDPDAGRISFESPIGALLLHHKVGDIVTLETKNGSRTYQILEIK